MTRTYTSDVPARIATLLLGILILGVCAYGVGILLMVQETAYRARAESSIRSLTSGMSVLENKYLILEEEVTLEKAHALGFVNAQSVSRVARIKTGATLSLRNEE